MGGQAPLFDISRINEFPIVSQKNLILCQDNALWLSVWFACYNDVSRCTPYLDLFGTSLKRVDAGYLLEPIQDDDDEAVVDFGIGSLADVELVQEETVE